MKTYLQLINKVLIRLREDQVATSTESDYSTLIGEFINKAKETVEDAWTWHRLRTTIRVTTSSGVYSYALTDAGDSFRLLERDSDGGPDVLDDTHDSWLERASSSAWMTLMLNQNVAQTSIPYWFDFNGYDSNGDPIVDLYPIPDSTYNINFQMYIPQSELTADATKLIVPWRPVLELAHIFAVHERGENGGPLSVDLERWERDFLATAIMDDVAHNPEDLTWDVQ